MANRTWYIVFGFMVYIAFSVLYIDRARSFMGVFRHQRDGLLRVSQGTRYTRNLRELT